VIPSGNDHIGRDVQALVLSGARQTLLLAFFGMVARLALGATLGALAGWWCGSRLDRLVMGATTVWAAFPTTIFALLLIQGLGIQQGMWVFVVALCVVGWGEVAQVVRQHVIGIKPQPFIEAARSVGAQTSRILTQHAMPSLLPILIVLAALEMGGILMLLAELGFLNVFLGGGFRVEIGQAGRMQAVIAYFSDVPEWGAMLSNIRNWWRSYPWMVWYAGVAFFLAILGFNLLGEGLRRFFERSRVNLGRLFGRYALLGTVATVMLLAWTLRNATPLAQYQAQARAFDAQRVMTDAVELASSAYGGRETGTAGAEQAARYIASRMEEIGLSPAGDLTPTKEKNSFIQTLISPRPHLTGIPVLAQLDATGAVQERFIYRQDFVERTSDAALIAEGPVVGVVLGPEPASTTGDPYGLGRQANLLDAVLIVPEAMAARLQTSIASAVLVVTDDPARWEKKSLFTAATAGRSLRGLTAQSGRGQSSAYISRSTAERLLATTGTSWASLETAGAQLGVGQAGITDPGAAVRLEMPLEFNDELDEETYNVIGFIPGTGAVVEEGGTAMDSQVIMVSAYYDGVGAGPDGTLYPGANDNASGVATMLEIARILKESHYAPKRTIVFVAWTGGERSEGLSVTNIMNAKIGFSGLTVESVVELSGTGAGDGDQIAIGEGSSYRLTQLFQKAAGRLNIPTTTRGRGPHHGLETAPGFGGRDALTLHLSWDGSDRTAHTPADTPATLSLDRLRRFGQAALLTISVMGREPVY
jgi:peptide/nickel transport system permease protein